jgi:hypothetical protein
MRRGDVGERANGGRRRGVAPDRRAAEHARLAVGAPDGAVAPAQRLPERLEHASAEVVGVEAGGDVVGDRLLGEQEPVRVVVLAVLVQPGGQHGREHLGQPHVVGREDRVGAEALDEGGEVAGAHGGHGGDERELRVGAADQRGRLARGDRVVALAAVDDEVPAAPGQGGGQRVGARDVLGLGQGPARAGERLGDLRPAGRRDVDEQGSERTRTHPFTTSAAGRER